MSLLDALIEDELWNPSPVIESVGPPDTRCISTRAVRLGELTTGVEEALLAIRRRV